MKILFRGRSNDIWYYGDLVHKGCRPQIIGCTPFEYRQRTVIINKKVDVESGTVGQYSGIKDQRGNMIFDGDIIKYEHEYESIIYICVVKYGRYEQDGSGGEYGASDCLGWYVEAKRMIMPDWMYDDDAEYYPPEYEFQRGLLEVYKSCEVIGNIYDNKELMGNDGLGVNCRTKQAST